MTAEIKSPPSRSRTWHDGLVPRFSLRTMFVLITAFCLVLGLWINRAEQQRAACAELTRLTWHFEFADWPQYKEPPWFKALPEFAREDGAEHYWRTVDEVWADEENATAGCQAIARLPAVREVWFSEGDLPVEPATWKALAQATTLKELRIGHADVDDQALANLATLPRLTRLDLQGTAAGDAGLSHLAKMKRLESLDLSNTNVTDAGMAELARLTRLRTLYLDETRVTSAGVKHLASLQQLETLSLDDTAVDDEIASTIASLPNLTTFRGSGTQLTDAAGSVMFKSGKVECVYLRCDRIGAATIAALATQSNLREVGIRTDMLAPGDLAPLTKAKKLATLHEPSNISLADLLTQGDATDVGDFLDDDGKLSWDDFANLMEQYSLLLRLDSSQLTFRKFKGDRSQEDDIELHLRFRQDVIDLAILRGLATCPLISKIEYSGIAVTDKMLATAFEIGSLDSIEFYRCTLSDEAIKQIAAHTGVVRVRFYECQGVDDHALETLLRKPRLEELYCDQISGDKSPIPIHERVRGALADTAHLEFLRWDDVVWGSDMWHENIDIHLERPCEIEQTRTIFSSGAPLSSVQAKMLGSVAEMEAISLGGRAIKGARLTEIGPLPRLGSLNLNDMAIGCEGYRWIASLPALHELSANELALSVAEAELLASSKSLGFISLANATITPGALTALGRMPTLQAIVLTDCQFDTADLEAFLASADQLESVDLNGTPLTPAILESIMRLPELKNLDVADCQIGLDALDVIARNGARLTDLSLRRNGLAADEVLKRIPMMPQLTDLNLDPPMNRNPARDWAWTFDDDFAWVRWGLARRAGGNPPRPDASYVGSRYFDLSSPLIFDDLALEMMQTNPFRERIEANHGNITGATLAEIAKQDRTTKLELENTRVVDDDMKHLARMTRLSEVVLAGCNVGDAGIAVLAQSCWRLKKIDLEATAITDAGLPALYGLRRLSELNVRHTQVTTEGVAELRKHLPNVNVKWVQAD